MSSLPLHLSLQVDDKVAFEDIPVFGYAAKPVMILRSISVLVLFLDISVGPSIGSLQNNVLSAHCSR